MRFETVKVLEGSSQGTHRRILEPAEIRLRKGRRHRPLRRGHRRKSGQGRSRGPHVRLHDRGAVPPIEGGRQVLPTPTRTPTVCRPGSRSRFSKERCRTSFATWRISKPFRNGWPCNRIPITTATKAAGTMLKDWTCAPSPRKSPTSCSTRPPPRGSARHRKSIKGIEGAADGLYLEAAATPSPTPVERGKRATGWSGFTRRTPSSESPHLRQQRRQRRRSSELLLSWVHRLQRVPRSGFLPGARRGHRDLKRDPRWGRSSIKKQGVTISLDDLGLEQGIKISHRHHRASLAFAEPFNDECSSWKRRIENATVIYFERILVGEIKTIFFVSSLSS